VKPTPTFSAVPNVADAAATLTKEGETLTAVREVTEKAAGDVRVSARAASARARSP
jgi:hypothetical protein